MSNKIQKAIEMGQQGVSSSQAYAAMGGDSCAEYVTGIILRPENAETWLKRWTEHNAPGTKAAVYCALFDEMLIEHPDILPYVKDFSGSGYVYAVMATWETVLRSQDMWPPQKNIK